MDDMTPSQVARVFAEKSVQSMDKGAFPRAAGEREVSQTFALLAIAEALEAANNDRRQQDA